MPARRPESPPGAPDGADFVECYRYHYPRLVRALRLSGADSATAEDVAQEAFARALARWRRVSRGSNPPGYVYVTGFRLMHRARAGSNRLDQAPAPEPTSPAGDEATVLALMLEAALAAMPPRRRACAVMGLVVGLPVKEVGAALGIEDGTVRKHLEDARRDLAPLLR